MHQEEEEEFPVIEGDGVDQDEFPPIEGDGEGVDEDEFPPIEANEDNPIDAPQEQADVEETPQEQVDVEETPREQVDVEETPQEQVDVEETPQDQAEAEETPQDQAEAEETPGEAAPKFNVYFHEALRLWLIANTNVVFSMQLGMVLGILHHNVLIRAPLPEVREVCSKYKIPFLEDVLAKFNLIQK